MASKDHSVSAHSENALDFGARDARKPAVAGGLSCVKHILWMGIEARAIMPGDALLFRGLSHSTIGADWFHVRVREGIGWVTDAMVTKQ